VCSPSPGDKVSISFYLSFPCMFTSAHQWLQFDIGPPSLVTGVVTRGRGDSRRRQWVTRFLVSYSNDSSVWYFYKDAGHTSIKVYMSAVACVHIDHSSLPFTPSARIHATSLRAGGLV